MVHLVNFFLLRHPAVLTVERHCYFGSQIPLPLFLPSRCHCHSNSRVSKLKRYSKKWGVVFDTTFDTALYSRGNDLCNANTICSINGRYLKFNSKVCTKDGVDMSSTSSKSTTSFSSITRLVGTSFFSELPI